ncbi:hypothetical protein AF72_13010 [Xylella taiwanensis]|uniref:Uncharacterized protein n=1 Tax=Xylella taiwanensis TaxID=1444770 RepID=Z9JF83_9GAMM|nr:hypothetical protein AF72_13010 [Xylella taiwanensis]
MDIAQQRMDMTSKFQHPNELFSTTLTRVMNAVERDCAAEHQKDGDDTMQIC